MIKNILKTFAALVVTILILLSFAYLYFSPSYETWHKEFESFNILVDKLNKDPRYDYSYVIYPYEDYNDRDGVDFSELREEGLFKFSSNINDSVYILVFIKNREIVAIAMVPVIDSSKKPPRKLIPQ